MIRLPTVRFLGALGASILLLSAACGRRIVPERPLPLEEARWLACTHRIDLSRPAGRDLLRAGWLTEHPGSDAVGSWGGVRSAGLDFQWGIPRGVEARLTCRVAPGEAAPEGGVRILLNDRALHRFDPGAGWSTERFRIPTDRLSAGWNRLLLRPGRPGGVGSPPGAEEPRFEVRSLELGEGPPGPPRTDAAPTGSYLLWSFPDSPGEAVRLTATDGVLTGLRSIWITDADPSGRWRELGVEDPREEILPVPPDGGPLVLAVEIPHRDPPGWIGLELAVRAPRREPEPRESPPVEPGGDNLLVIVLDATNPAFLGAWGDPAGYTPNWDRLARRGVQYSSAQATAPFTIASVGTMVTGLLPIQHRVLHDRLELSPGIPTLAEGLREVGYSTGLITGMAYSSSLLGYHRGFDHTVELFRKPGVPVRPLHTRLQAKGKGSPNPHPRNSRRVTQGQQVVSSFRSSLEQVGSGPWYLFVHIREPHGPYDPEPPLDRLPDGEPSSLTGGQMEIARLNGRGWSDREIRDLKKLYRGNVHESDRFLGQILDHLATRGLLRHTWVFVLADHGEAFGRHGRLSHNSTLYGDMIDVPLLVLPPGEMEPRLIPRPVSLIDLVPSLCRLAGATAPPELPGRPLPGLPGGDPPPGKPPILYSRAYTGRDPGRVWSALESVRRGLLRGIWDPGSLTWELYDLEKDPGELDDLAERWPATRELLEHDLRWFRELTRSEVTRGAGPDPELSQQLEALGYVD